MFELELEYDLTRSEYRTATRHLGRRLATTAPHDWKSRLLLGATILGSGALTLALLALWQRDPGTDTGLVGVAVAGFLTLLVSSNLWSRVRGGQIVDATASDNGPILGHQLIRAEPEGLRHVQPGCESLYRWEALYGTEEAGGAILLLIDRGAPVVIPARAFPDPGAVAAFRTRVAERARGPQTQAAPRPAAEQAATLQGPGAGGFLAGLAANLREGLRVTLLQSSAVDRVQANPEQFIGLVLLGLIASLGADILSSGFDGYLNWWGLPSVLFYLPFLLLGAWLVARRESRPELTIAIGTAIAAAAIFIDLGRGLADGALRLRDAEETSWLADVLPLGIWIWWTVVIVFAGARLSRGRLREGLPSGIVLAAVLSIPIWLLPAGTESRLWYPRPDDSEGRDHDPATSEESFYLQPDLLARRLNELDYGRPGIPDVYFVGFAGYGSQDVFAREVWVIERLLRERFDAEGRTVKLINNPRTVLREPIATRTALARTLEHMGRIMDRDEDVLVLYLTSHGSKDHRLSVSFWPWDLHEIDPPALRRMLDDAGIKWRVIAISACYSGGFIEALKDEHTLVMTAADEKSQSFGCGYASDFTYFGKALFDEELRRTRSFPEAFAGARASIDRREQSEKKAPSNPQIFVGSAMEDKLKELDARLAATPKPATPSPDSGSQDRKIAAILDLWEITRLQPIAYRECISSFDEMRPESTVIQQPEAFGGIRPDSPEWPQVIAAFDRYAKTYCALYEPEAFRNQYARGWEGVPERDLDRVLRWLESDAHVAARKVQNRVAREIMAGYSEQGRAATREAMDRFSRDIETLRQAHSADGARRSGAAAAAAR